MNRLNKTDLFHALFDAFRQYTDSVYFEHGENPYQFSFEGKFVNAFIVNVHSAGAGRSTSDDEYRIQCPGRLLKMLYLSRSAGDTVLVLGFFAPLGVFSAWDPDRFLARNPEVKQVSIYTRLSHMQEANAEGFSTYNDRNEQKVIMFRSDLLGLYVENSIALHQANDEELRYIFDVYSKTPLGQPLLQPIEIKRQKIQVTRTQYSRSPRFTQEVLRAYSHKCAMCGIQLDLVEAAHIVPHAHPKGTDTVSNSLALCALHHRSFDTGLLYVQYVQDQDDYLIHVNPARVEHLKKMGRVDELQWYKEHLRCKLLLPDEYDWRPAPDNLILGNVARGVGLEG